MLFYKIFFTIILYNHSYNIGRNSLPLEWDIYSAARLTGVTQTKLTNHSAGHEQFKLKSFELVSV